MLNIDRVMELLAILDDPAKLAAFEAELQARRAARMARHSAKVAALRASLTLKAEALVHAYEAEGAAVNKWYTCRATGNVAAMLVKSNVWNHAKGRMGTKLIMVYPDGSRSETFEKTISIKREF